MDEGPLQSSQSGWRSHNKSANPNRISISTPEEGTSSWVLRIRNKEFSRGGLKGSNLNPGGLVPIEHENSWLSVKMKECGDVKMKECEEAVGITVDNNKGGRNSLLAFAHRREQENRKAFDSERIKRKGSWELQSLTCSINYEKTLHQQLVEPEASSSGRKDKGVAKGCK